MVCSESCEIQQDDDRETVMAEMTPLLKAVQGLEDCLLKAKRMPVGTVSKGRKKIAEGKWITVKENKQSAQNKPRNQTETPEFKAWFGDSKVVDESGKPLVVYHGTHGDFKEFKPNESLGGLIFLSESAKEAGAFASVRGANIIPVYLKAEKVWPKVIHASDEARIAKKAKKLGYDAIRVRDDIRGEINWAVFSPTQIKSATGNRGTFDPNEADMTKAK